MESGVDGSTSAEVDGARTAEKHGAGFSCFIAGTCECMKLLQRMSVVPQSHMVCHLGCARSLEPGQRRAIAGNDTGADAKIHGSLPMLLHTHASMTRSVASMGES